MSLKALTDPRSLPWRRRPPLFGGSLSLGEESSPHAGASGVPRSPRWSSRPDLRCLSRPALPSYAASLERHQSLWLLSEWGSLAPRLVPAGSPPGEIPAGKLGLFVAPFSFPQTVVTKSLTVHGTRSKSKCQRV